jgi:hypothetical protein
MTHLLLQMARVCLIEIGDDYGSIAKFSHNGVYSGVVKLYQVVYGRVAVDQHRVFNIFVNQFHFPGFSEARFGQNLTSFQCVLELVKHLCNSNEENPKMSAYNLYTSAILE